MRIPRKYAAGLLAPLLAVTGVVGLSGSTATAQNLRAPDRACDPGALCVYRDVNFRGPQYQFFDSNDSWRQWEISDDDSSSWNRRPGYSAIIHQDVNNQGLRIVCIEPGGWRDHHDPNDEGSSNNWIGPDDC